MAWFNVEGCESERCLVIFGGVVVGGGGEFESAGGSNVGRVQRGVVAAVVVGS